MTDSVNVTLAALAELLCRRCVEPPQPGDAETARRMINVLADEQAPPEMLAVAVGGVWAGYRPDESLTTDLVSAALGCARALLRTEISDTERSLTSAALGLLAVRGAGDQPAVDLVNAAVSARRVEQHDVALWAAEQALVRRDALSAAHEAMALLTAAVITRDPATITAAYEKAAVLPSDDLAARSAESLRPTLHPQGTWKLTAAGDAVRADDRPAAAASLAEEFAVLRRETDDDLLRGLHETLVALSTAEIDVNAARAGLTSAVGHFRRRQRFGQIPPVARAGLDIVADLLTLNPVTADAANVLTELLEALADAGLSELVDLGGHSDVPAIAQARLTELAQREPAWPDLRRCVDGLRGRPALIMRRQRMLSTGQFTVLGLYVVPPDSLAIKKTTLSETESTLVAALNTGRPENLTSISTQALQELIRSLLPASLIDHAREGDLESLLIVPDGPLWSIPWQAADLFDETTVTLAPSLSVHARVGGANAPIRRVTAVVDDEAPGAQLVYEALQEARANDLLEVRLTSRIDSAAASDLLLIFGHGGGTGLRFRTGTSSQPLEVLALATAAPARAALVAACWSAAAPPVSFPINLPAAMLLSGVSTVVGGLWPLPAMSTAEIVSATIAGIAAHGQLLPALAAARSAVEDNVLHRWGLAVHGAVAFVP